MPQATSARRRSGQTLGAKPFREEVVAGRLTHASSGELRLTSNWKRADLPIAHFGDQPDKHAPAEQ